MAQDQGQRSSLGLPLYVAVGNHDYIFDSIYLVRLSILCIHGFLIGLDATHLHEVASFAGPREA